MSQGRGHFLLRDEQVKTVTRTEAVQDEIEKQGGCSYCYVGEEKAQLMMARVAEDLAQHRNLQDPSELIR